MKKAKKVEFISGGGICSREEIQDWYERAKRALGRNDPDYHHWIHTTLEAAQERCPDEPVWVVVEGKALWLIPVGGGGGDEARG